MDKLEGIVILKHPRGYTATVRFTNPKFDKIFSSPNHKGIYQVVTGYVKSLLNA